MLNTRAIKYFTCTGPEGWRRGERVTQERLQHLMSRRETSIEVCGIDVLCSLVTAQATASSFKTAPLGPL